MHKKLAVNKQKHAISWKEWAKDAQQNKRDPYIKGQVATKNEGL